MKYVLLTLISLAGALPAAAKLAADLGPAEWYGPPRLPVLMGFVKDPQHHRFKVLTADEETALTGAALHIHPDSAETVIWTHERRVGAFPYLTSQAIGAGRTFLAAASEESLGTQAPALQELLKAVIGRPKYRVMDHRERHTVRLRHATGETTLHVIDTRDAQECPMNRCRPLDTRLAVDAKTCTLTRAPIMPDGQAVETRREGEWLVMELFPDPELTIVLE